jgi:F-type H+-transporting ATPase subunit O
MLSSRTILRATRAAAPQKALAPRAIASSQIRSYATPATADPKPPVALYGLDGTYASALVCRYLLRFFPWRPTGYS